MPALAIPFIASVITSIGVSVAVATFVATVFVYAASAVLLNAASRALAPKAKKARAALGPGLEVNYFDTEASIRIIYGTVKTGGMETLPPFCTGTNNERLQKLITVAGHKVNSFFRSQFDDQLITNSQIYPNSGTAANSDGGVIAGAFSGHAWIRYYDGRSLAPTFDNMLAVASKEANARDIATVAVTLKFNQSIFKSVPLLTFQIQGKDTYDPRLDPTPGNDPTNTAYLTFNQCPALHLADYLMAQFGGRYDKTEIDWSTVISAANICDATVPIPTAATQPRYTSNGVLLATDEFIENVKTLANSMLGQIIFRDGQWRMYAGGWQAPTFTINQNDWVSGLSIKFEQGREKKFNRFSCFYVDPLRNYQRVQSLPISDTTLLTQAGNEIIDGDLEQLFCNNEFEAQRKSRFLLKQSFNQVIVSGTLPPRFQNLAIWDTGTIVMDMFGWASKTFRIINMVLKPTGDVDVTLAEEQETDWTDPVEADYNQNTFASISPSQATTPTAPSSFSAEGQINGTVLFTMGQPVVKPMGTKFRIIRATNSSNALLGNVVWEGEANVVPLVMPTSTHWYWSQCIVNSTVGAFQPNTFGITVRPYPQASQRFASLITSDPEFQFSEELGVFWTHSKSSVFSLTLAQIGQSIGGSLIVTPQSRDPLGGVVPFREYSIYSIPNTPYSRYMDGQQISVSMRVRALTAISSKARHAFNLVAYAWNGNTSNVSSFLPFIHTTFMTFDIATGTAIASGDWLTATQVDRLIRNPPSPAAINSYPFALIGLTPAPVTTSSAGDIYSNSGEIYQIDFFSATLI